MSSGDAQFGLLKISNPGGNQMVINNVYSSGIQIRGNWIRIQDATGTSDYDYRKTWQRS